MTGTTDGSLPCPWCGEESGVTPFGFEAFSDNDLRCRACSLPLKAELDAISVTDGAWDEQAFIHKDESRARGLRVDIVAPRADRLALQFKTLDELCKKATVSAESLLRHLGAPISGAITGPRHSDDLPAGSHIYWETLTEEMQEEIDRLRARVAKLERDLEERPPAGKSAPHAGERFIGDVDHG